MFCRKPCGIGGFGQVCEDCWGEPLQTEEGRIPVHSLMQVSCPGNPGHGPITVGQRRRMQGRKLRYRPDGSVERVRHPGRVISLPSSLGGR